MRCFFWLLYVVVNCFLLCVYVPLLVLVVLCCVVCWCCFGMCSVLWLLLFLCCCVCCMLYGLVVGWVLFVVMGCLLLIDLCCPFRCVLLVDMCCVGGCCWLLCVDSRFLLAFVCGCVEFMVGCRVRVLSMGCCC